MTPAQLNDRILRLEVRIDAGFDRERREQAVAEAAKRLVAVVDALARGEDPNNMVSRALVAHNGNIAAALTELAGQVRAAPRAGRA